MDSKASARRIDNPKGRPPPHAARVRAGAVAAVLRRRMSGQRGGLLLLALHAAGPAASQLCASGARAPTGGGRPLSHRHGDVQPSVPQPHQGPAVAGSRHAALQASPAGGRGRNCPTPAEVTPPLLRTTTVAVPFSV